MNRNIAFRLAVRMESTTSIGTMNQFYYPLVVETDISLVGLKAKLNSRYSWSKSDTICLNYWEEIEQRFIPLTSEDTLFLMFA